MVGTSGQVKGKNYIVAPDAETGKPAWRFNSIAQPGEPGGDSWNGHTAEERNGASVWVAGSYDSQLNLAFFGVAQTYDTQLLANPVNKPGVTNDDLPFAGAGNSERGPGAGNLGFRAALIALFA